MFGELLPKQNFYTNFISKANAVEDYGSQIEKFKKCEHLVTENFGNVDSIALQNPLKLCNNAVSGLNDYHMKLFIDLCKKSNHLINHNIKFQ